MDKKKCPLCKKGNLKRANREEAYEYKGKEVVLNSTGEFCDNCQEGILDGHDLKYIEKKLHNFRCQVDGFLTSDEIRNIRKKLNLTQKEAAIIFGGGVNAFSRYENGEALHIKATDNLLRLLDSHPDLLAEVKSYQEAA